MILFCKYVFDPSHVLNIELPKVASKRILLMEAKMILKVDMQHLQKKSFQGLLIKWKDYPEDEAFWKREIDFWKDYPTFVTKGND